MPSIDLVYNPYSGNFRPERLARLAAAFESHGFAVEKLATRADGAQLSGKAEFICVQGGDGTLRDTLKAMVESDLDAPLCIARTGTINLVARELNYPADPDELADMVAKAWAKGPKNWVHSPLYALGDMPIASCLSIGPDSQAVARVSGALKKRIGRFAYAVAMLRQLREWPRNVMTIRGDLADGERFECEAEAAIVSHGALYAGPFQLSPAAALAADSVELITLSRSTRLGTIALTIAAMLRLPIDKLGIAEIRTCQRIEFDRCVAPVQVDGDHMPECAHVIRPSGRTIRYLV